MHALRTRPFWLAFAQPTGSRSFALGHWVASFVMFSCIVLSAESAAWASCGDWLANSQLSYGDTAMQNVVITQNAGRWRSALVHSAPTPCNGPNCGQAPQLPPQPVSTAFSPAVKVVACGVGGAAYFLEAEMRPTFVDLSLPLLSGYPPRIDRPPAL